MSWLKDFIFTRPPEEKAELLEAIQSEAGFTGEVADASAGEEAGNKDEETKMEEKNADIAALLGDMKAQLDQMTGANKAMADEIAALKAEKKVAVEGKFEGIAANIVHDGHFAPSAKEDLTVFLKALGEADNLEGAPKVDGKSLTEVFAAFYAKGGPVEAAREANLGDEAEDAGALRLLGHAETDDKDGIMSDEDVKAFAAGIARS